MNKQVVGIEQTETLNSDVKALTEIIARLGVAHKKIRDFERIVKLQSDEIDELREAYEKATGKEY